MNSVGPRSLVNGTRGMNTLMQWGRRWTEFERCGPSVCHCWSENRRGERVS